MKHVVCGFVLFHSIILESMLVSAHRQEVAYHELYHVLFFCILNVSLYFRLAKNFLHKMYEKNPPAPI